MVKILRCCLFVLAFCFATIDSEATEQNTDIVNKKIWEKIFEVISSNTNSDPFDWIKKELGVTPLLIKGNRVPIKHNYYLTINFSQDNKPSVQLENDNDKFKTTITQLKSESIYILGRTGIVNKLEEGSMVLVYESDCIYLINLEDNTINRLLLKSKTRSN